MQKKQMVWKTKGMNQDLSVSAFNPEFAFENKNLRLDTKEGNTQLSWVNERGTARISLTDIDTSPNSTPLNPQDPNYAALKAQRYKSYLWGHPIGTAVVGNKLIVFTHNTNPGHNNNTHDYIYQLEFDEDNLTGKLLYEGELGFNDEHPLETLVSYESEDIQKVYWTDGINQPRVINIVGNIQTNNDTQFDFLPAIGSGSISVARSTSNSGIFAPGVIQYCFTYYNKHGQQSNVVDASSLHYISYSDRGASPEDKVSCSFTITISSPSTAFDYVRIYSIQRTSLDAVPVVKIVSDIKTSAGSLSYTDNGTTGVIIDPTELLYIGGKEIKALTMTDKDGTLFLGNISMPDNSISVLQNHFKSITTNVNFVTDNTGHIKSIPLDIDSGIYNHTSQLGMSQKQISAFKAGNTYRFGFQLQRKTGEWTEPVWIRDKSNTIYPSVSGNSILLAEATATISLPEGFNVLDYKNVRPMIVLPTISDREVLCQGVLNPTVFNSLDRMGNSPYAQASWYFRPIPESGITLPSGTINPSSTQEYGTKTKTIIVDVDGQQQEQSVDYSEGVDLDDNNKKITITPGYESEVTDVYVLVANISADIKDAILFRRCISIMTRNRSGMAGSVDVGNMGFILADYYNTASFIGAIILKEYKEGSTTTSYKMAFISKEPWNGNIHGYDDPDITTLMLFSDVSVYQKGVSNPSTVNIPFPLFVGMKTDKNNIYYYTENDSTLHTQDYIFKFYDANNKYYEVIYNTQKTVDSVTSRLPTTDWTDEFVGTRSGNDVQYLHYGKLFNTEDLTGDNVDAISRFIEIQGSGGGFGSVTGTIGNISGDRTSQYQTRSERYFRKPTSNTEFFVDASIVTLNSPDIEFNTEVQSFDTSGLKMRIVGYIPITSVASAHKITTSSSMLENKHNLEIDGVSDNLLSTQFGSGELSFDVISGAGKRLVADYLWNDVLVGKDTKADDKIKTSYKTHDFLIHPWHRTGSLNNDFRKSEEASSLLKTKKESNLLYSNNSTYVTASDYGSVNTQIHLTENDYVINYRLPNRVDSTSGINYYPNIDKVLYNENGYKVLYKGNQDNDIDEVSDATSPISMKYKSTSHAVVELDMKLLGGYGNSVSYGGTNNKLFWKQNSSVSFTGMSSVGSGTNRLLIGELYRDAPVNQFGGQTLEAIRNNNWIIGGDAVPMTGNGANINLTWTVGDTYYQRYDCLKTYPFTNEDTNQIVEILSFMCETYTNIDGRYDRNRGQRDNTNMSPRNFNLLNPVYNQQNNFFNYKQIDEGESKVYPNQLCFTGTKNSGADVDEWTHITLGGVLELDGDKGQLTSLQRLNNNIIAFQEKGISRILYNENAAISTTAGVPIELGNSGKVQGKQYISDTIGCSNKWSICNTPNGIYFMDSNEKSLYLFNGQLTNLSMKGGMNSWSKRKIPAGGLWNPVNFGLSGSDLSAFVSYYDKENQDVLFVNKDTALAWSEKFGTFTSFYDYGGGSYFNSIQDIGVWAIPGAYTTESGGNTTVVWQDSTLLYQHNKGSYCNFFGQKKPYWMTLVGNPEPLRDKTFTNLEFRATVKGEGSILNTGEYASHPTYKPLLPFDSLECWDEYQHGIAALQDKNGHDAMRHFLQDNTAHLDRKFRIWRCDIPRDNMDVPTVTSKPAVVADPGESATEEQIAAYENYLTQLDNYNRYLDERSKGIARYYKKPMDRMRNPWIYLKLMKNAAPQEEKSVNLDKAEIHDVMMSYFV